MNKQEKLNIVANYWDIDILSCINMFHVERTFYKKNNNYIAGLKYKVYSTNHTYPNIPAEQYFEWRRCASGIKKHLIQYCTDEFGIIY